MKRLILYSCLIVLLIAAVLAAAPLAMDINKYKPNIQNTLSEKLGLDVKINGEVNFSFFLLPHFTINDLTLVSDEHIIADHLQLSVYTGVLHPFQVDNDNIKLSAAGGKLYLEQFNLIGKEDLQSVSYVEVDHFDITFNSSTKASQELDDHNSLWRKNIKLSADLVIPDTASFQIKSKIAPESDFRSLANLNLKAKSFNIDVAGSIDFSSQTLRSKLNFSSDILNGLNLSGSVIATPNSVSISNIKNTTDAIKDLSANMNLTISDVIALDAVIESGELDLKPVIDNTELYNAQELLKTLLGNFDFEYPDYLAGSLQLSVDKLLLPQSEFNNLKVDLNLFNRQLFIDRLHASIPGDTEIQFNGLMARNDLRAKLEGQLSLNSDNVSELAQFLGYNDILTEAEKLKVNSSLIILPYRLLIRDADIIKDDTELTIRSDIIYDNDEGLSTNLGINLKDFNANEFNLDNKFDTWLLIHYASDQDKTGRTFNILNDNFKWLRTLSNNISLDLHFDRLKFKELEFKNFVTSIELMPNFLRVSNLHINSTDLNLEDSSIELKMALFRPQVNSRLNINYIDSRILDKLFPSHKTLNKEVQKLQEIIKENSIYPDPMSYYRDNLNFFGLHNYDGSIDFTVGNLNTNINGQDISLRDTDARIDLNDGILAFTGFRSNVFEGALHLAGNLTLITTIPSLKYSFNFNNINPSDLLKTTTRLDKITGYMSIGGSISSRGLTTNKLLNNMEGNINFIGKDIIWDGFDLSELVRATELNMSLEDRMQRLAYYKQYGSTNFNVLKGNIAISNGIASINNTSVENNRIQGVYAANYNLVNRQLNSVARFAFYPMGVRTTIVMQLQSWGYTPKIQSKFDTSQVEQFLSNSIH